MEDIVIEITDLKKKYRLGSIGGITLTEDIKEWLQKKKIIQKKENLQISESNKKNSEFWALDTINLKIKRGETLGIIGTNGAGKSTLLKILSRVTAPTEGCVYIKGKLASMLEVGTGFHGELTGRQNIYINGAILGMSRKEVDAKIEDIIEFSECRKFIDTPVKRYSSGMYVKLAFSVAAHLDADIMIMDEILAVGDAAFQKKCLDKMRHLAETENRTILYVSHNMNTIRSLCKRCIVLDKGKLSYEGDVEGALRRYLKMNKKDHAAIYNCEKRKHIYTDCNGKVKIKELQLIGKTDNYIEQGDKCNIRVTLNFKEDVSNMAIRMIVHTIEAIPVGAAMSKIFHGGKAGEIKMLDFQFDSSQLAPGEYLFNYTLSLPNGYGGEVKFETKR